MYGRPDILINDVAGNFLCSAEDLTYKTAEAFKAIMKIDAHGTFNASKAAFEKFFKNNGGNIISISATLL